nr:sulfatase-like hydrolase/transferase [uncultured Dysosmobacter sp.]
MSKKDLQKRPNILFLMADQFRGDMLGCLGGPAKTPNLDALVAEGICFTNCMTSAPLCVPARISMMTGKYPHTTGAWNNAYYVLSPEADLWTKVIKEQGYGTGVIGKLHLHTDFGDMIAREPIVHGYGFDFVNEISGPHSSCQTRTHMTEEWQEKGVFDEYCKDMNSRNTGAFVRPSPLPLEEYYDVYVGREGRSYLESYTGDAPWFCHVSFGGPHEPWDTPKPYADLYDGQDMPEPLPIVEESAEDRPRGEYDRLMAKEKVRCDREMAAKLRADYSGSVTLIDEQIGGLFQAIRDRGEWDHTVVLFVSDHEEMNGDHGLVHKRSFFRPAINIPLILRTPETAKHGGAFSDALVSLLDVGPTLVELSGGEITYEQMGRSLCHMIQDPSRQHRDYLLAEYAGEIMYMDRGWKIVCNAKGEPYLLFDLVHDSGETKNLIGAPEYAEEQAKLERLMLRVLAENRCLRPAVMQAPLLPEDAGFQRSVVLE